MQDRIPLYPGRVKMTPVAGQANTFDMVRADDPTQAGTPLNKATLLKDATAALYGLGTGAVPDDVLAELGKYKQYWWRRRIPSGKGYEETKRNITAEAQLAYSSGGNLQISKSISIDQSTGAISLVNPESFTLVNGDDYTMNLCGEELLSKGPCYITGAEDSPTLVYFLPPGGGIGRQNATLYAYSQFGYKFLPTAPNVVAQVVTTNEITKTYDWAHLQSSTRSAYPDSGTQDGYEYEYLGIPFDNAVTASKIETGSYVGTGTYGRANPNALTFGFVPKFVWIYEWVRSDGWFDAGGAAKIPFEIIPEGEFGRKYPPSTNPAPSTNTYSKRVGSTLYWYNTGSAGNQLNYSDSTYYYIAIG